MTVDATAREERAAAPRRDRERPAMAPPNPAREIRMMDSRTGMKSVRAVVISASSSAIFGALAYEYIICRGQGVRPAVRSVMSFFRHLAPKKIYLSYNNLHHNVLCV